MHIYLSRPSMKSIYFLKFNDRFSVLLLLDLSAAVDIAAHLMYFPHLASRAAFIFLCLLFFSLPHWSLLFFFFTVPSYLSHSLRWECTIGHGSWKSSLLFPFNLTQSHDFKSHL